MIELLQSRVQYYRNYSDDTLNIYAENANAGRKNLERLQFVKINLYSIAELTKYQKLFPQIKPRKYWIDFKLKLVNLQVFFMLN